MAWFYKSFFLMAEYGGARAGYGFVNGNTSTPINFSGYHVTASYFLTGEQLTRRVNVVKPRRDFNFDFFKGGQFSPGAWEVYARYSTLDIGNNIFTGGFADPNLWTNHVWTTDIGLNWYFNFYTRIYLDWQHAMFGNPVSVAPGRILVDDRPVLAAVPDLLLRTRMSSSLSRPPGKRVLVEPAQVLVSLKSIKSKEARPRISNPGGKREDG